MEILFQCFIISPRGILLGGWQGVYLVFFRAEDRQWNVSRLCVLMFDITKSHFIHS